METVAMETVAMEMVAMEPGAMVTVAMVTVDMETVAMGIDIPNIYIFEAKFPLLQKVSCCLYPERSRLVLLRTHCFLQIGSTVQPL